MRSVPWLCCALGAALLAAPAWSQAQPAPAADPLVGLWKAERRLGPEARGPLLVQKTPAGWRADFMGRSLPITRTGEVLSFDLPDGQGSFRAKLQRGGGLSGGQWIQPWSPTIPRFAVGVRLAPDGPGRWRGVVEPIDDTFTFYLEVKRRPDGSLGTFLRNPERNLGVFYKADRLELDGATVRLVGRGPGAKVDGVLMSGPYDAANHSFSLYFPERGGTFDFHPEGPDSAYYPRGQTPERYVYRPPPAREDGWPTASLEEVGIDRPAMERFVQHILDEPMGSLDSPQIDGVLIARHGKLVLEEYFHGENRDRPHETRSASKSLTTVIVGAALQAGLPVHLSDPVYKVMNGGAFPDGLEPMKRRMTLENLLTMSSGFFCDDTNPDAPGNEDGMTDQTEEPDYYRFTLKVPLDRVPGEKAVYCSADPNLALGVLSRATGEHVMDIYDRLVGGPLQISRDAFFVSPALQPYGGGSARMLPRDFMKLGQLMLNGGTWKGRRILSADFVRRASGPLYDLRNVKYGYLWWGIDYPYKDRTVHAFFAGGNGGQGVVVVPELDMVIAIYGSSYATHIGLEIQQGYPPRYILPAVREAGDRTDAPVAWRDYQLIYGRKY